MQINKLIADALDLIASIPGYSETSNELRRRRILYDPNLPDRGQLSLFRTIRLGPEPFSAVDPHAVLVEVAGTLVHEQTHAHQILFSKTISFWSGIATRTDPMRRYEWPAYARQIAFMKALAAQRPDLMEIAEREAVAILASFEANYGIPNS